MTSTLEHTVDFDTTEGLLYRALCCLIERHGGHVEITLDDLESVGGRFVMSARDDTLILTTLKGGNESEH